MEHGSDLRNLCAAASEDEIKSGLGHGTGGCHESGDFYDNSGNLFPVIAGTGMDR